MAGWLLPVLLPLLLAGPPALGNEGGAAGACGSCKTSSEKPGKLRKYAQRMSYWEPCLRFVKFTFPQGDVYCGLKSSPWVEALMKEYPEKEKGAVMPSPSHVPPKPALTSAPRPPTSTSPASLSAQPPTVSLRVVLDESPAMHPAPEVPKDATQPPASTRSPAPPSHDPLAAGPASQAPQTAERGVSRTVVLSLLAVTLVAVAIATITVCQRRHRRRVTLVLHRDPEEQIHLPHREET
ncbi:C-X-C motif chemokine 16 [Zootoca vivipara]|uniref:C-X-C motif chemokine 16 n=1 Tax=Zootoca vivipara TaxID=8524 RepID=UPI00159021C7|nr:C-X-C motif chemokine 16 [Zootoca vivipara]